MQEILNNVDDELDVSIDSEDPDIITERPSAYKQEVNLGDNCQDDIIDLTCKLLQLHYVYNIHLISYSVIAYCKIMLADFCASFGMHNQIISQLYQFLLYYM